MLVTNAPLRCCAGMLFGINPLFKQMMKQWAFCHGLGLLPVLAEVDHAGKDGSGFFISCWDGRLPSNPWMDQHCLALAKSMAVWQPWFCLVVRCVWVTVYLGRLKLTPLHKARQPLLF